MNKFLRLVLLLELLAAPAAAQTVRADRVTLNAGPCVITSGSAAPNGSRVGNICDTFIQTGTGAIWTKTSGTGTSSGWLATLAGTGTPGTLPVWTSAGAIGDSIIAQAGGVATITGSATITGTGTMNAASITNNASIGGTATIGTEHVTGSSTIDAALGVGGNTTLGGYVGTASYASQVSGWRITNTGAADVRYLFTDELRAKLFTADKESVLAGSMRVTKSYSTIAQPFTCPAASATTTLWVFDAATYGDQPVFQTGDAVLIHVLTRAAFGPFTIAECIGQVTGWVDGSGANAGQQMWTFQRAAGADAGSMAANTPVAVNELVQDMGVPGNGYVEMSALDGAGAPYIQTNTWQVWPTAGNITTQCRLGNVAGLTASANEYGLVCGAPGVTTQPSIRLSNQAFQLRNLPIDVWNLGAQVLKIDPTVPSLALGNPLPASFAGGNAGLWMGRDTTDSVYKLRIGNATNFLTWNGTTLSMAGNGSGITNINGGNIQAGTITSSQVNITPAGAALNDDPNTSSSSAWADNAGLTPATILSITDGVVGSTVLRSQVGHSASMGTVKATPIDAHKTYRIHAWARAASGATGWFSLGANLFTSSGYLTTLQPFYQQYPGTLWTEYTAVLAGLPAAAVAIAPTIQLNAIAGNAPVSTMEVQDVRIEEVLPSTLIKDGAITTVKIQAGAITADQIAANTITVANLNASGFGDNLIKNSTFEGSTQAAALAGWSPDPTSVGTFQQTCCGDRGPGTLLMVSTGASNEIAEYAAVPVQAGQTYRVSTDAYVPATSGGFYFILLESTSTAPVRYVRQSATALGPGDVAPTSSTTVCNACTLQTGWQHVERSYTVPAGVNWVSLSLWNFSCPGPCQSFYFDAVEMQPQIGAGHILANSITADRIVAHSLTAAQILGGTITGTEIAGNTITGAKIAGRTIAAGNLIANTITSNEIGVGAIVAGNIAAGTITANEIAANTITANKLNVSTLSAITANLGAVNAGSLNAVTITGSTITGTTVSAGCATMDSNGITLTAGGAACNWYKWSNGGTGMSTDGGAWMYVQGQNVQLIGTGSGSYLNVASDAHLTGTNQVILDSNNNLIHLTNNGYLQLQISSLSGTAAGSHMCLTTDNYVIRCT